MVGKEKKILGYLKIVFKNFIILFLKNYFFNLKICFFMFYIF